MKRGIIIAIYKSLSHPELKVGPLKVVVAKNLKEFKPIVDSFNTEAENKFNELVVLSENGDPVISDRAKEAFKKGALNASKGVAYECFEYEKGVDGLKELKSFIAEKESEEVEVNISSIELSKKIRLEKSESTVEELLSEPAVTLSHSVVAMLMEVGIII